MLCATAAPTRHPPGEAHSLPAPAPLVPTFLAGPRSVTWAVDGSTATIASAGGRRLRRRSRAPFPTAAAPSHSLGVGDPSHKHWRLKLSPPVSLSPSPQLQPAQPLWTRVAKNAAGDTNALGDTTRHATARPPSTSPPAQARTTVDRINMLHVGQKNSLATLADSPKPVVFHSPLRLGTSSIGTSIGGVRATPIPTTSDPPLAARCKTPTPHSPLPTPHTPLPTPHSPHPTPHSLPLALNARERVTLIEEPSDGDGTSAARAAKRTVCGDRGLAAECGPRLL